MAIKLVPLKREHVPERSKEIQDVFLNNISFTALRGDEVVATMGVTEIWPGRGWAWVSPKEMTPREWLWLSHKIKEYVSTSGFPRIETVVEDKFEQGYRWAEKCGLHKEAFCRKIMPDGKDGWLYVRIQDGPTI